MNDNEVGEHETFSQRHYSKCASASALRADEQLDWCVYRDFGAWRAVAEYRCGLRYKEGADGVGGCTPAHEFRLPTIPRAEEQLGGERLLAEMPGLEASAPFAARNALYRRSIIGDTGFSARLYVGRA